MLSQHVKTIGTAASVVVVAALLTLAVVDAQPAGMSADRHKTLGVSCADCHGKARKPTFVEADKCLVCHGPAAGLVQKTAAVKPENPHASPHWGTQIECSVCHRQHEKTVNWCAHCHNYGFKVP